MIEIIKTSLCHPKYIGLFFKNKLYKIILIVFLFFAVFSGSIITKCLLTDQFGTDQAFQVQKIIQYSSDNDGVKPTVDIKFDSQTNKITGKTMVFKSDDAVISFRNDATIIAQNALSINLFEDGYVIYYGYYKLGSGNYNNEYLKSFDISKIQSGDALNSSNFRDFLVIIFDNVQISQALVISFQSIISNFVYYILLILFCLLSAYFFNPTIELKIRFKLVLLDSLSYFYWYLIAILTGLSFIEYIAFIVPLLFTTITFAHIKRVR